MWLKLSRKNIEEVDRDMAMLDMLEVDFAIIIYSHNIDVLWSL